MISKTFYVIAMASEVDVENFSPTFCNVTILPFRTASYVSVDKLKIT
jgi:hypothetical protein